MDKLKFFSIQLNKLCEVSANKCDLNFHPMFNTLAYKKIYIKKLAIS